MSFQNGDVVFFKKAKKSTKRSATEITFKGHGFGVFLGHVPQFAPEPPSDQLIRLMGTIGFMTFDDVAAFAGDDVARDCVKKFEDKYYGKAAQEAAPEVPAVLPTVETEERPRLVLAGPDGQPIKTGADNEPTV